MLRPTLPAEKYGIFGAGAEGGDLVPCMAALRHMHWLTGVMAGGVAGLSRGQSHTVGTSHRQKSINHNKNVGVTLIRFISTTAIILSAHITRFLIPSCLGKPAQFTESTGKLHIFKDTLWNCSIIYCVPHFGYKSIKAVEK